MPRPLDDVVSQDETKKYFGPEQLIAGVMLYVEARDIMTKSNTPYTAMNYYPIKVNADGTPDMNSVAR